jgi:hypothetical protein
MLGSQPVEQHAIRDFSGQPAHLGAERRHDDARREVGPQLGDPCPHALEGLGIRTAHPEEQPIERQSIGRYTLDDAARIARVQRDDPDAQLDAPRLLRRHGERRQSICRPGMVDPEGGVSEPLGLPC